MPILSARKNPIGQAMYLVDTTVISEARKGRRADAGVQAFWSASIRDDSPIFLAVGAITPKPCCMSNG